MRRVILESPYAGKGWCAPMRWWRTWRNVRYARRCVRHALARGEAPIASHLLYTQPGILRDTVPAERQWGIQAGLAWQAAAQAAAVYVDRGISAGMEQGIAAARARGIAVEFRSIQDSKMGRALRSVADVARARAERMTDRQAH